MKDRILIVITGPTATGKTALGAHLARELDGEVVSADSMQIYQYMDIGTAKPSPEETLGVPHHMIDIVKPWEDYSAARYVREAAACIDEIFRQGRCPVLVGGSGLYIDSLLSGRDFAVRGDPVLRSELEKEYDETGGEEMLRKLNGFDPESAAKLNTNDKKRIVRAFEVYKTAGKTISSHDAETKLIPERYNTLKFALTFEDRSVLYSKINKRVDTMLANGLESEVRNLLDMGVAHESTAMQAIGYKEITGVFKGDFDINTAVDKIKMESRRYAKRQLTWLRRDKNTKWITWTTGPDINTGLSIIKERLK